MTKSNMSDRMVWYTDMLISWVFNCPLFLEIVTDHPASKVVEVLYAWKRGYPVEREDYIDHFQTTQEKHDATPLPSFFNATFPCVSEQFRAFIEPWLGGRGVFYPIDILKTDGTPRPERYFIMNIRIQQAFWLPYETNLNARTRITDSLWIPGGALDDRFAVTKDALTGADIWFDPRLSGGLFLSDRLKRAFEASDLGLAINFYRCVIFP